MYNNGSVAAVESEAIADAAVAVIADRREWEALRASTPRYRHAVQSDGKVVAEEEEAAASAAS